MVVDKYCQIVERDTETISVFWKVVHILSLLTAAICSIISVSHMDTIMSGFGHECVLFPKLVFTNVLAYESVGSIPLNLSFHNAQTLWGSSHLCAFSNGTFIFSMIVGIIMLAFFIILPKGGYSKDPANIFPHAWKFIPLAICAAFIMTICICIAYYYVHDGFQAFTDQLYAQLMEVGYCTNCRDEINIFTLIYNEKEVKIIKALRSLKVTSTIVLISWLILNSSLFVRMFLGIDFKIVIYNIKPGVVIHDDESSVSSRSYHPDDILPSMKKRGSKKIEQMLPGDDDDDDDDDSIIPDPEDELYV